MEKKFVFLFIAAVMTLSACKEKFTPEGPTDIRIKNLSTLTFEQISVNTSGGTNEYETLAGGEYTEYKRFDKAYPYAEITATIGGEVYTTGPQNYNYQVVLGEGKFTYEVYISNPSQRILAVSKVIPEAPLD
jgi:hypothetical protein